MNVYMRRRVIGVLALAALALFLYSFLGTVALPKGLVAHYRAGGEVAGVALDRSVVFNYGEPILAVAAVDGDTLELINGELVRYNGIDTPEENDPRKNVQCYAKEAHARNAELVEGKMVTVMQDVSEKDLYGRWIGVVYLNDGTMVNEVLVREGYAFAYKYKPDINLAEHFAALQDEAREARRGLWSYCTVYKLSSGRLQTNDVN